VLLALVYVFGTTFGSAASRRVDKYEDECLKNLSDPISVRFTTALWNCRNEGIFSENRIQAAARYKQERANTFIGITEQELIRRLGQPEKVTFNPNTPDGPAKILLHDNTENQVTLFAIFESDGRDWWGTYRECSFSHR
jgi:hypothetical protein